MLEDVGLSLNLLKIFLQHCATLLAQQCCTMLASFEQASIERVSWHRLANYCVNFRNIGLHLLPELIVVVFHRTIFVKIIERWNLTALLIRYHLGNFSNYTAWLVCIVV